MDQPSNNSHNPCLYQKSRPVYAENKGPQVISRFKVEQTHVEPYSESKLNTENCNQKYKTEVISEIEILVEYIWGKSPRY